MSYTDDLNETDRQLREIDEKRKVLIEERQMLKKKSDKERFTEHFYSSFEMVCTAKTQH